MSITEKYEQEVKERAEVQSQLNRALLELEQARQAMIEGRGEEAEKQRLLEEQLEKEKEKRVEHAKEMAIRRIVQKDLSRGWTAWVEPYKQARKQKRMLLSAGARLLRPKLVAAVTHWKKDWEYHSHVKATMSLSDQLAMQTRETQSLEAKLLAVQEELNEARQAMADGRGMEAERERQMKEQIEADRQKRIEHTQEVALRRIGKQDLTSGWMAWYELYSETIRMKRALLQAGSRILKPKLTLMFTTWRDVVREEKYQQQTMSLNDRYEQEVRLRGEALAQVDALTKELEEARQAMLEGRGLQAELERQAEERLEKEREKRIEGNANMAMRRMQNKELSMGWTAWVEPYRQRKRMDRLLRDAGNRILKPKLTQVMTKWKRDWEGEMMELKAMSGAERMGRQIEKLTEQLKEAHEALENAKKFGFDSAKEEAQRQMEEKLAEERRSASSIPRRWRCVGLRKRSSARAGPRGLRAIWRTRGGATCCCLRAIA